MPTIAVAVRRVDDEATALERRILGVVADILGIENAAADHEAPPALLGGLQQFPQVRHRAVVEIRRGRPDSTQYPRLVCSSGNSRRRIEYVTESRLDEGFDLCHRIEFGLMGEPRVEQRLEVFV